MVSPVPRRPPAPRFSGWAVALALVVVFLGGLTLLTASEEEPEAPTITAPIEERWADVGSPVAADGVAPLAELIPGLEGTLVLVGVDDRLEQVLFVWDSGAAEPTTQVLGRHDREFAEDPTGSFLARLGGEPDESGWCGGDEGHRLVIRELGTGRDLEVAADVDSFAWRRPPGTPGEALIAWTRCEPDGSRRLLITKLLTSDAIKAGSSIGLTVFEAGARLTGWGESGIWVSVPQDSASRSLVLVDEAGWPEQVPYWTTAVFSGRGSRVLLGREARRRWTFAGIPPDGDGPVMFEWAPPNPRAQRNPFGDRGAPFAAWGSTAAESSLAFIGFGWEGGTAYWLEIWDAATETRTDRVILEFEPHRVAWDQSGRYVLMPGTLRHLVVPRCVPRVFSGLFAYHTETGRLVALDMGVCGVRFAAMVP